MNILKYLLIACSCLIGAAHAQSPIAKDTIEYRAQVWVDKTDLERYGGEEDFKKNLAEESIRVTEHVNGKGAYGISLYMENVENAHLFKGADLSRKLTYQNIQKLFDGVAVGLSSHINRVGEFRERVEREAFYMQGGDITSILGLDITGSGKKSQEDDFIPSKKKRKRKSGPDFSL